MFGRYAAVSFVCLTLAVCVFAQGLTTKAGKDDWEEINFEFNSSVLSDGYPSLLRLAELLKAHADYKVRIEGHTDFVGSDSYNDRLAMARANTVRDFLVKYGASPNLIETSGRGKRSPEVDNRTREGRFMNRRVVLTVTDAQGRKVSDGGIGDAIKALTDTKKLSDCCDLILKKLDEVLAALRDLKGENEKLKAEVAELKARPVPRIEPLPPAPPAPKPLDKGEIAEIATQAASKAVEASKQKKFSLLGVNVGPDTDGHVTFTGKGRFFSPFNSHSAFQAEGEYLYYRDRQEGQFDFGLVNRLSSAQVGLFSTFKHVNLRGLQNGGTLGQGAFTLDYLFRRGRIGFFGTKGFLNDALVNRAVISRNVIEESYLRIVDQVGGSTQIGLWGDSYVEGNLGALFRRGGENKPGGTVRLVQPIRPQWAFTVEAGLNETLVGGENTGRVVFGLQFGNWVRPKEFTEVQHPVPVDIPRLRYELLKRRVRTGNDPPVADCGPEQIRVQPGTITLDGSASYDPDADPITYEWAQIAGPPAPLSSPRSAKTTFDATAGNIYSFRLTVRDDHAGVGAARCTVTTEAPQEVKIVRFSANPPVVAVGGSTTITWEVLNADEVTITPILGRVDPRAGSSTIIIREPTTFRLTARNRNSEASETLVVTVQQAPQCIIQSFLATPATISPGAVSTLSWQTQNCDTVSVSPGIGRVASSGTSTVSPTETTTYRLEASGGGVTVNATATVQVSTSAVRVIRFVAVPPEILPGEQSTLSWEVENATRITITGLGEVQRTGTANVSPTDDTTYTLVASNGKDEVRVPAKVTVIKKVKIVNFTAEPTIFKPGEAVVLTWKTENATDLVITPIGRIGTAKDGSMTVHPTALTTYTLIAYGNRSSASAVVVVKPDPSFANRPPIPVCVSPVVTDFEDKNLDCSRSYDPDGDPITFSWRQVSGKTAMILNPTTATPTVWLPERGDFVFEVTVTDNKGASTKANVRVTFRQ